MTRRDTIIVAVLINASLLVMLFISALKNDTQSTPKSERKIALEKEAIAPKKEQALAKSTPDQIDHVLAQYANKKASKEPVKEEKKIDAFIATKAQEPIEAPKPQYEEKHKKVAVEQVVTSKDMKKEEREKVIVKKGDVLEKIAKTYGTTVGAIMQENALIDSKLQVGQVLYIPQDKVIAPAVAATALQRVEEQFYVVKNGDNLWKIALEYHMKVEELLQLNHLTEKQAKALRPGDKLRIK